MLLLSCSLVPLMNSKGCPAAGLALGMKDVGHTHDEVALEGNAVCPSVHCSPRPTVQRGGEVRARTLLVSGHPGCRQTLGSFLLGGPGLAVKQMRPMES